MATVSTEIQKPISQKDKKFLELAFSRFKQSADATIDIRKNALEDLNFRAGEQWPEKIKASRDLANRPCLTINRLPQFVRQVSNDLRQNRPAITVSPVHDDSDIGTAEILQGIIRHIEYASDADVAYDTASTNAVTMSFGYVRVLTEYSDPKSFDQEIKINRIRNPFTVYMDPTCQSPVYADAKFGFIIEDYTLEAYKAEWPNSQVAGLKDWTSIGDIPPMWMANESIRVAEYFYIEREEKTLVMLSDDSVYIKDDIPKGADGEPKLAEGLTIKAERKTLLNTVKWKKINALEVLEETDWLGSMIPIVPVLGDELDINGKVVLESMIRHAKDPQRMYNFWASAETEMIALAPKAPWVGAEGQFEGHEREWNVANTENQPYLEYKPTSVDGTLAPPPSRNVYEPPIQAITVARGQSAEDLKATIGMYDPGLGNVSNETSGRAILARQSKSDTGHFHFSDNLARTIKQVGKIVLELIPLIYDKPRTVRIVTESGESKTAQINRKFTEEGIEKIYDVTTGKYDVAVSSGPSYNTKRQEAAASMQEAVSAYPDLMRVAGDLMVKNFDWPGAQEIAARLAKTLPPELQDNPEDNIPPQVKQQMANQDNLIQEMGKHIDKLSQKIETQVLRVESNERIANANNKTKLIATLMECDSNESREAFVQEMLHINGNLKILGEKDPTGQAEKDAKDMKS